MPENLVTIVQDQMVFSMRIVDIPAVGLSIAFAILALGMARTWLNSRIGFAALSAICFALASLQHAYSFVAGYFPALRSGDFAAEISELEWLRFLAMSIASCLPALVGALAAVAVLQRLTEQAGRAARVSAGN